MSDFLSRPMWLALFEIAERRDTTANQRTVDALAKRKLIEKGPGGRWTPSPHGTRMITRVVQFDVT